MSVLHDGDTVITYASAIEMHVLAYFQNIFRINNNCVNNDMVVDSIPSMVTDADNAELVHLPLMEEIKVAVFLS